MSNPHLGSNFDDFLAEEGLLEEAEAIATKRVLAFQIAEAMREHNLSKSTMAQRMKTSRSALDRLLDPDKPSVTLLTIEKAARALGKRLHLELTEADQGQTDEAPEKEPGARALKPALGPS